MRGENYLDGEKVDRKDAAPGMFGPVTGEGELNSRYVVWDPKVAMGMWGPQRGDEGTRYFWGKQAPEEGRA